MVPVFLFAGFLESGKTTLINDLFASGGLARLRTLLLLMEEGEEDLIVPEEYKALATVCRIEDPEQTDRESLEALRVKAGALQVVIEYNGMWPVNRLSSLLPSGWLLYRAILTADAETFRLYNMNMRSLCADKLRVSSIVMYNRVKAGTDTSDLRRLVRAVNRKAEIYYEFDNGEACRDESSDDLPYDLSADPIIVADEMFAVWQLDLNCFPEKYAGKKVSISAMVIDGGTIGRRVMTCCEADIEWIRFRVTGETSGLPGAGNWIRFLAEIEEDGGQIRLRILKADQCPEPVPDVALF